MLAVEEAGRTVCGTGQPSLTAGEKEREVVVVVVRHCRRGGGRESAHGEEAARSVHMIHAGRSSPSPHTA
eukprot:755503-Hanusia_phi.AAC.4